MRWFKHDSDAHMDAKMRRLIHKWGIEGYGLYWYCLELIAKDVGTSNLTFELEHDAEILAHDMRMSREKVEDMMRYMVDLKLFESSGGRITCLKLFNRIDLSQGGSKAFRDAVIAKRNQVINGHSHVAVMTESCIEVDVDVEVEIENKSKGKGTARKRFVPPSLNEIVQYVSEKGLTINPKHFHQYFTEGNWHDAKGNPVKNWKQKILTWDARDKQNGQAGKNGVPHSRVKTVSLSDLIN